MIDYQIYEMRPDGSEWHSVPLQVNDVRGAVQSVIAGYSGHKRAAIAPDGKLLYGMGRQRPNGACDKLVDW